MFFKLIIFILFNLIIIVDCQFGFISKDLEIIEETGQIIKSQTKSEDIVSNVNAIVSEEIDKTIEKPKENFLKLSKEIYYGTNDWPVTGDIATVLKYLTRFGYIDHVRRVIEGKISDINFLNPQLSAENLISDADIFTAALKEYQKFMRLKVTGIPNKRTIKEMNKPRCANKDLGEEREALMEKYARKKKKSKKRIREKRYALAGSKWKFLNLTYKITKYPSNLTERQMTRESVDNEFRKAFNLWSDITQLTFFQLPSKTSSRDVNIDIRFDTGEHGDGDSHDGAGKILAHAFFPQFGGNVHFDDDEMWSIASEMGTNLFMVAVHELAHALGLDHSTIDESVMNPSYAPFSNDRKLCSDDVQAIQLLYGSKTAFREIPDLCKNSTIDAMFLETATEEINVFKGQYLWKIKSDELKLRYDYPVLISDKFPGFMEENINAAFTDADGSAYLFKGTKLWKYGNAADEWQLLDGYPKTIEEEFASIPDDIDTAFQINGNVYAFKNSSYWKSGGFRTIGKRYEIFPQPIDRTWTGIKGNIDAAMAWGENTVYFFIGDYYYRLNGVPLKYEKMDSVPPYPRKISYWWFGCKH